ncbi:LNS2-domain-containing protein [Ramaria rubella]|nr:LNS2-domain-containing protein [Ramaria rubella]
MNYLRGALSAASQYYKDLPPINPSTLTGAIDVIVIERPTEDGGSELICSPFHVRFGKWQVLRPGEKKVKVLVNGHSIPFDMKIGDAGEAFFVFETDEDVPDELITSPLLQATVVGHSEDHVDPPTGRFGAKEGEQEPSESVVEPGSDMDNVPQEPEFLDLDASQPESKPSKSDQSNGTTNGALQAGNVSGLSATRPTVANGSTPGDAPSSVASIHQVRNASPNASETDEPTKFESLKAKASAVRDLTMSSLPLLNGADKYDDASTDEDVGDAVLPRVDARDVHPPDVTYHHDVVLDVSGYHSKEASERTIVAEDKWSNRQHCSKGPHIDISSDLSITPDASRSTSPESLASTSVLRTPRATSEPPEYGVSSSPPPEYSWEWGAFPQRSPTSPRETFFTDSDIPHSISFAPRLSPTVPKPRAFSRPRSRSPIPEAEAGTLEADTEDPYRVWLDFEGQRLGFEISLCGDILQDDDPLDGRCFDEQRVTFKRFMDDSEVAHSPQLVVRWDDEYICRSDDSPLMPALVNWRRRTLSRPVLPERNGVEAEAGSRPLVQPRPSTWSRWWSRGRTLPDAKQVSPGTNETPSGKPYGGRPSLEHSESAPADTILSNPQDTPTHQSTVPFPSTPATGAGTKFAKTLRLTSDQLKSLGLQKGPNSITFSLSASGQIACTARIFMWDASDHIVVSDIDGTITKSDALGHVFTMIGRDWTHLGVAKLYTDIFRNGYKIMYLTSRAIGQADSTRDYLKGINQNNYQLPEGPVIMSPDRLLTSLHREVIMRKPELFKMACLRDIQRLFGPSTHNAFYAGFGNRITDALSYRSVNVPSGRIFTIDSSGEVKMELLELAGYKSSYIHMTDIVDQMFPPVNRKWAPEYTDFNYWRVPVKEYELPEGLTVPPSPSLSASARSDTSSQTTLSRLRQFSLGRSSRAPSPGNSISSSPALNGHNNAHYGEHVRAASSHDRFGSFLPIGDDIQYVDARGNGKHGGRRGVDDAMSKGLFGEDTRLGRSRNRPESMPGSLDLSSGMQDPRWLKHRELRDQEGEGDEDEDEDTYADQMADGEEEYAEEAAEEAFDDDLLATGEMETVPFL